MLNYAQLVKDLERDESIKLNPYLDTATPPRITIGIGRNLTDNGITREEAYYLCNHDIEEVLAGLDQHLLWWRQLEEPRQRVLANMAFNLGVEKLLTFHTTLWLIQSGHYPDAAAHMLRTLWAREVGDRAHRLADMMDPTGAYKKLLQPQGVAS